MIAALDRQIARLRQDAEHCRLLSSGAVPHAVATQLKVLADEFEGEAEAIARQLRTQ